MTSEKSPKIVDSVLVIGGCGFLGYHIVSQLLDSTSAQISVLDLRTTNNRLPSISYYDGDITSEADVRSTLEKTKPAIIIHTASPPGADNTTKALRALYKKVNIDGTRNLVERAGEAGCVKAFIYTSSASVIHDTVSDLVNADERWPILRAPKQREYYSETKGIAECIVLAANRRYGNMLTAALRPATIFGEGDTAITPNLLKAYKKGQTRFQLGSNQNLFDFTYVGNVANAHILAAVALVNTHALKTRPLDHEKVDGEAFFITNDQPIYFWDFARRIWLAAGDKTQPSQVWVIQTQLGLVIVWLIEWLFWLAGGRIPNLTRKKVIYSSLTRYYNIDKAKNVLGYEPQVGVEEGVERTVKWFKERDDQRRPEKKSQ